MDAEHCPCPGDDCGHPIKPGCAVHVHGKVLAIGPDAVTVRVCSKDGAETGQVVTCEPCCVHCDDHPDH